MFIVHCSLFIPSGAWAGQTRVKPRTGVQIQRGSECRRGVRIGLHLILPLLGGWGVRYAPRFGRDGKARASQSLTERRRALRGPFLSRQEERSGHRKRRANPPPAESEMRIGGSYSQLSTLNSQLHSNARSAKQRSQALQWGMQIQLPAALDRSFKRSWPSFAPRPCGADRNLQAVRERSAAEGPGVSVVKRGYGERK